MAKHADQIFSGLIEEAAACHRRAGDLTQRISAVKDRISKLDYRSQGQFFGTYLLFVWR